MAQIVTGNPKATATEGAAWLQSLVDDLQVPGISTLCGGVKMEQIPEIVALTMTASSTKGNPVVLSKAELEAVLTDAL